MGGEVGECFGRWPVGGEGSGGGQFACQSAVGYAGQSPPLVRTLCQQVFECVQVGDVLAPVELRGVLPGDDVGGVLAEDDVVAVAGQFVVVGAVLEADVHGHDTWQVVCDRGEEPGIDQQFLLQRHALLDDLP
ncbi:hypothetical protein TU94_30650 [Streptomyces cyaneogriseus subsp. noncyanogenus]|uniref:Uncharacterized protein n=1 Tax=Streptomyces cyaneogriseus subsp. noncyanogenus TaxID=477245 RepID=A0A0C5G9Y5_9ACTN|nr:hypothetical protein TU94_30650 [Streptomyces cyaneogriseus subsp. noncyanogenus]